MEREKKRERDRFNLRLLHPYCAIDVVDYIYYPLNRLTLLLIIPQVAPNKSFTCHL